MSRIPKDAWRDVFGLRDWFAETYGDAGKPLYGYQRGPSDAVLESVLANRGRTIPVEFSRQSGKTEAVTTTALFLMVFYHPLMQRLGLPAFPSFQVGFFAPQFEQVKTDFDRLKDVLTEVERDFPEARYEEANGNTVRLANGSTAFCFSLSPTSHPESKTLHLIVLEEAQDLIDQRIKKVAQPMGANTNATEVWIGTAGYHRCAFLDLLQGGGAFINDAEKVIAEKRRRYEATGDPLELAYEAKFRDAARTLGRNSDEIRTQYLLEWILERGQFITADALAALEGDYEALAGDPYLPCVAGVDFGKVNDSTVLTVLGEDYRILAWLELQGDDYESQFLILQEFLSRFPRLRKLCCDATGNQDMIVDRLRARMRCEVEGVVLTPQENDQLYKGLAAAMLDRVDLEGRVAARAPLRYPRTDCVERERFTRQFLDLGKEVKANRWVCKAPEGKGYHDDYCDSLALAVRALGSGAPSLEEWKRWNAPVLGF